MARITRGSTRRNQNKNKYTEGLPDQVINMIMCLLSSKIAARSSIVSKQWATIWSSVTMLNFEEDDHHPGLNDRDDHRRKFMAFLRRCLKCRDKEASLDKLRLRMTFLGGDKSINKWMSFALERNAKELDIGFKRPIRRGDKCRHYYFLWAVFSFARSLTILKLENMRFKDNFEPISLPCLKTLALQFVKFMSNLAFSHLISGCPSLETLSLASCSGSDVILSSSTLKSLKISCCNIKIKVEASNLEIFRLIGQSFMFLQDFNIASCRKLKNLEFVRSRFAYGWFEGLDSRFPLLEGLILQYCMPLEHINVVSRSLQQFSYFDYRGSLTTFSLKAPNLSEATIVQGHTYIPYVSYTMVDWKL